MKSALSKSSREGSLLSRLAHADEAVAPVAVAATCCPSTLNAASPVAIDINV